MSVILNALATTVLYTLSLHDALPICHQSQGRDRPRQRAQPPSCRSRCRVAHAGLEALETTLDCKTRFTDVAQAALRSEEHTSELQSLRHLVCRLLLEKKKKTTPTN